MRRQIGPNQRFHLRTFQMALRPTEAAVEVIRTAEVVDKPKTEAGMKKLFYVPILCMALLLALGPACRETGPLELSERIEMSGLSMNLDNPAIGKLERECFERRAGYFFPALRGRAGPCERSYRRNRLCISGCRRRSGRGSERRASHRQTNSYGRRCWGFRTGWRSGSIS